MKGRLSLLFLLAVTGFVFFGGVQGQDSGKVTLTLQIVEGDPSAESLGERLQKLYQDGGLSVGYPISDFQVKGLHEVSSGLGPLRANSFLVVFCSLLMSSFGIGMIYNSKSKKYSPRKWTIYLAIVVAIMVTSNLRGVSTQSRAYDNCKLMNKDINYKLYWSMDASYIYFKVSASSTGWMALGLSGAPKMDSNKMPPGNDIAMGFRNPLVPGCETGCINDYSTVVYDVPILDPVGNAEIVSFTEDDINGISTMEWKRLLDTGDSANDRVITPNTDFYVLYAIQASSKPDSVTSFAPHTTKGWTTINFSEGSECPVDGVTLTFVFDTDPRVFDSHIVLDALAQTLGVEVERFSVVDVVGEDPVICPNCITTDFIYNNYDVPAVETTYICKGFDFPTDQKYHIVGFEPLKDNLQVLHHMVLYQTNVAFPPGYSVCNMAPGATIIYAWAPGEGNLVLPDNVGFPVGAGTDNLYGVLQMHYNNPTRVPGVRDSSGLRMHLSTELRPNEAGLVIIGTDLGDVNLPPGKTAWHQQGGCPPPYTSGLGSTVLNIFASFVHMHTRGRMIWTEQFRNNVSLGNLGEDLSYDFNAQGFKSVTGGRTIVAGDDLVIHCVWNTEQETTTITGGESTQEEMCFNLFLYWPFIPGTQPCTVSNSNGCNYGAPGCPPPHT